MTRFLRALLLCAVCVSPAYAGDQSGIEPKTKAVSPSFSPPITPTILPEFRPPPASFGVCSLGYHFQALECGV